jgi:hypothetical protein
MKSQLLILLLIFCISGTVSAQVTFGIRAGYNHDIFGGPDPKHWGFMNVDPVWKPGYHLGGAVLWEKCNPIILESGLYFTAKGTKYSGEEYDYEGGTGEMISLVRIKDLKYLDIPIHARYNFNENFSVFAGPQVSFLLSAKVRDKPEDGETIVEDVKSEYSTMDISFDIGATYFLSNGVNFQLQYDHGLADIVTYGDADYGYDVKNRVIRISIGILLHKSKEQNSEEQ